MTQVNAKTTTRSDTPALLQNAGPRMKDIAVLIDGDNVSAKFFDEVFSYTQELGRLKTYKVFGSSRSTNFEKWDPNKKKLGCFKEVEQERLPPGKNATDMAMTIAAMDLFHQKKLDTLCLVTHDGDFVPLVERMKKAGITIRGLGSLHASRAFQRACDSFYVLGLRQQLLGKTTGSQKLDVAAIALLRKTVALYKDKDGWATLSDVSRTLACASSSYAENKWGHKNLTSLLQATGEFLIRDVKQMRWTKLRTDLMRDCGDPRSAMNMGIQPGVLGWNNPGTKRAIH